MSPLPKAGSRYSLVRTAGRVYIDGLQGMDFGGSFFGREDSQVACLVAALRCAGQNVSYADVMGLSACAFKITLGRNVEVASMHSEFGMEWAPVMRAVFGLDYDTGAKVLNCGDKDNPDWRNQLLAKLRPSIERGIPMLYMDAEWNLLVGYAEDGSTFICLPYAGVRPGKPYKEMARPRGFIGDAWFAAALVPAGQPMERKQAIVNSLKRAVRLTDPSSVAPAMRPEDHQGLYFGFAAYENWIDALAHRAQDMSAHGNAFSYSQLLTSRRAAGDYLRSAADTVDAVAVPLKSAAARYAVIADRLLAGNSCVQPPWEQSWTAENRAVQVKLLRDSLADERAAVDQIKQALVALGM